ncbi:hypothetical protein K402DRAFT_358088 [Aulographum hederae CBS 113979]|uniref:SEC7 domain-containing protein n=1 Tax=Aulographum hederae CBS 113979 TaxID=1176131 RepID=A0A6G1GWE2_9PEZI|nr:hypothetical protein K402DRAFT_358088 [Aulographum hederae CBS 113979]
MVTINNSLRPEGHRPNGPPHQMASSSPSTPTHSPTVARDPVALVVQECISVTAAMRKHARWAHSSVSAILGGGSVKVPPSPRQEKGDRKAAGGSSGFLGDEESAVASRWGLRGKKGKSMQDNPLMSAFTRLRNDLKGCKDLRGFDTPALLHPFLQVIRSSSTSAAITSLALSAITKFLAYGLIVRESPRLPLAMQLLSSAITHCRFEASDTAADEIVLLRILKLMERMVSGPGGDILSDESICEIMETGLSMCCQFRLSELLRRNAEISMVTMCQVIFERLKHLEIEAGEEPGALEEHTKDDMDVVKMDPSGNATHNLHEKEPKISDERPSSRLSKTHDGGVEAGPLDGNTSALDLSNGTKEMDEEMVIKPYSLPSIRELFRVLVDLLDPHDKQHTDTMRVMALRIVDVALEVAGPSIANHPSLATLAKDTLCRHLFQLVRSENMAILNESLRVAGTLLATCRGVLKLQQELFLAYMVACLFPRVEIPVEPGIDPKLYAGVPQAPGLVKPAPSQTNSGRSTPVPVKDRQKLGLEGGARKPDAREAMVESLGALVRIPEFMCELFVNYDCEIDRSDLCVDIVGLLSRNAFPDSATWSTTNVPPLCLDALLGFVNTMADRLDDEPAGANDAEIEALRRQRRMKKIIIKGATKFNENPKAGLAFLASQGIIDNLDNPSSVAKFLKGTTRIDKRKLGEFIAKKDNTELLSAYMDLFDFAGQRVDEALRQILYSFRLPGESQLIERIVVDFSAKYCSKAEPEYIANEDACFILTYAIIMLNVDQHSPKVKGKRMAVEDFAKNLRGTNDGKDYDPEFTQAVFDAIKAREIVLPEEHDDRHSYDHAWKELLVKIQSASDMASCETNVFDSDMFAATWKPIVATLSYVFLSATDDAVFSRVVIGFNQCAQIAAKYGLSEALDHIIFCLSSIGTLASEHPPNTSLNTEVQVGEKAEKNIMVSETAVRFGRDPKAQLSTIVLSRVVLGNEDFIRDGWGFLTRIMLNLFMNSLIPPPSVAIPLAFDLPAIPLHPPAQIIDRGDKANESGLFSALSSYVSSFANDEPPEPSDQEIDYTLCTVDCITECSFEEIFSNISDMPLEALKSLMASLLELIPEDASPQVIAVKPDLPAPSPVRPNAPKPRPNPALYDPTVVFVLELATLIALRDEETVEALGKDVADTLQSAIRQASKLHFVTISRAVYYLLKLLRASNNHDYIRAPVILHAISSFDDELMTQCSQPLLKGLSDCVKVPSGLRNEIATSPDFWVILNRLQPTEAAADVFQILNDLVTSDPIGISVDNYEAAVALLNKFATSGSIGAQDEQRREYAARRGKQTKTGKTKNSETVTRGTEAMNVIYQMTSRVPHFIEQSHLETTEAWNTYWSPVFRALTQQCLNPCREIRQQAFSSLQRTLLSADLASPSHKEWTAIFGEVLFPLITQLLKPEVYQSDPSGMAETRVQAATLLCKIFLHYLVELSEWEGMLDLWMRILGVMDRLMNSGQGDNLEEALPESLKNILLVMTNAGLLKPPEEKPDAEELWTQTWKRLDRFLPDLFKELFPEEANKPRAKNMASPVEQMSPTVPVPDEKREEASEKEAERGTEEEGQGQVQA